MSIQDPEFIKLVDQIEELEQKLVAHPLHKVCTCPYYCLNVKTYIVGTLAGCILLMLFAPFPFIRKPDWFLNANRIQLLGSGML